MIIVGIDPGPKESGFVKWNTLEERSLVSTVISNEALLAEIKRRSFAADRIAIERIRGFGMQVGNEVFDTVEWIGRLHQAALDNDYEVVLIGRQDVKHHLNVKAGDKFVREALIYRFGAQGTKKSPGKLYGISGHCWSALAVAVTVADQLLLTTGKR